MTKMISKNSMYEENTIAVKYVKTKRKYRSYEGLEMKSYFIEKDIKRICYLKICWNCGTAYESLKHNSFACQVSCRRSLIYKLQRSIKPPVRMNLHLKAKNIELLKERFEYL